MGIKAEEPLEISSEELTNYLHANHSVYMVVDGETYYITDANDRYWRVQRTDELNEKGHYIDCTELVDIFREFLALPFKDGTVKDAADRATFYASLK